MGWLRNPDWQQGNSQPLVIECDCGLVADRRVRQWDGRFGFGGWLLDATFDSFNLLPNQPGEQHRLAAVNAALEWAQYAQRGQGPMLVLRGGNGTGKTHLAAAAANLLRSARLPAAFANVPEMLDWLRSAFRPDRLEGDYDDKFEALKNVAALVLDDLGAQAGTVWANEKLYELVNHRTVMRLPLLVTTNLRLADFEPRLASRLRGATVVDCGNFDYRQVKA